MASSYMAGVQNQRMVSLDDDSWFFSQSWQAGEAEATADIAHGRVDYFDNEDEFLNSL